MKKIYFILFLLCAFIACDDETKDGNPEMPIKNMNFPSESKFQAGGNVVIQGEGFLPSAEIWFSPVTLKSANTAKVLALDIQVTATSISFTIPASVVGSFEILLKQDGKEYVLGTLKIEKRKTTFYSFCYDYDKGELVELDLENSKMVWTGVKIPGYGGNSRGACFDIKTNEFVGFEPSPATVYRANLETKSVRTIVFDNKEFVSSNFNDIVQAQNGKFYSFCYDDGKNELAELDLEKAKIVWTGIKTSGYLGNDRGTCVDRNTNELVVFAPSPATIYKMNLETKSVRTIELGNAEDANRNFDNIIRSQDNKFYAFCYDDDKNELAELDLENKKIVWTGVKAPDITSIDGMGFDESTNELVIFSTFSGTATVYKVNMETKSVKTITLENMNGARNFRGMISR